ncbi:efflux transporter periplasmic adaptor subunit [Mucilaginibacter sp. MD40]|uniref:efflux RND transporter periplasmic adaptor subunit n=1 Tax=Mucilaginibacter sp. MD40 TaxID=2029590 RepID=UPI000BAC8AFA|nr:efflux RND transporter periplasmic adaptor subunit [Mucilaginibacter sp. MD40]PAW95334.1 efflux transporter periplasmic adaptor subunit [Mucilaginibacter sp. MD40]
MKFTIQSIGKLAVTIALPFFISSCGSKPAENSTAEAKPDTAHQEDKNTVEVTAAQYKAIDISLGSAEPKNLAGLLKVNGFIDVPPQNLVSITTQMGGIVKSTPLLQGSSVSKGEVIAVLQNQDYVQLQQDYLESKSQLELSDTEYKRQQELSQQNVNSQKVLQQSKAQYQTMLARENALKQRLRLINISPESLTAGNIRSSINIYAPISGYVTKVNVNTGKFVNPNDVMFEIVNSSNLHVELNVFEKDAEKVKPGQKVRFNLSNDSTDRIAVVQLVGREINADKTVTVHAIAKGSIKFIPGTYLKAYIETGTSQVTALPETAIVDFQGKKYVFVHTEVKQSNAHQHEKDEPESIKEAAGESFHFEMVEVTTGISDGGFTEVQLSTDQPFKGRIVLKGAYDLLSKMKNSEEE